MNFTEELAKTTKKSVAPKNRVVMLLDELEHYDPDNHAALIAALKDYTVSNASITRTINRVWGEGTVKPTSVREYRAQNGLI